MAHRQVRDLMTAKVAFVCEDTPYREIVELQAVWQVNALPVVDAVNRVVGIVSEADLLPKPELAGGALPPPLTERLRHPDLAAKAAGVTARDVMSRPAATIRPEASVVEAARLLQRRRLKTLPVVDAGDRLVGVISRRDVLRVFLRGDEEIRREIQDEVFGKLLRTEPPQAVVSVRDGVATLYGQLDTRSMIPIAERLARGVDGVVDVVSQLVFGIDDLHPGAAQPARF